MDPRLRGDDEPWCARMSNVVLIIIAVVAAFLAFRFIAGLVKFGVIALIVLAVIYFLSQGGI